MGGIRRSSGMGLVAAGALLFVACGSNSVILRRDYELAPSGTRFAIREITVDVPAKEEQPPEHFLVEVKSFLKADLAAADAGGEGDPADWQIAVKVVSYRMRSGFSRFMFGMLAGKDGVDSQVQVLDASGKVLGDSNVSTFNVTAVGSGEDVAKMHADEIAKFVLGDKRAVKPARAASDARAAGPDSEQESKYPKRRHSPGDVSDDYKN